MPLLDIMPLKRREAGPIQQYKGGENLNLDRVYETFPRLRQHGFEAGWGDPERNLAGGSLEFYGPDEERSPRPGTPFIEVYDRDLKGDPLDRALAGDALHYLPDVDPRFSAMRDEYWKTRTEEQKRIDLHAYERIRERVGEKVAGSYDTWVKNNRKDAHLRGFLAPDERNEWAGSYTPEQLKILQRIRAYLQTTD